MTCRPKLAPLRAVWNGTMEVSRLCVLCVALLVVVCTAQLAGAAKSGEELNAEALMLAKNGQLKASLPLFLQAVEAAPHIPEYHNNAGVTELRLGNNQAARAHFQAALDIDPGHSEALMNIKELNGIESVSGEDDEEDWFEGIQHEVKEPPTIHINDLFKPENIRYARGWEPFVLKGAMETPQWRRARRRWSADYFAKQFPDSITDFYPHNMEYAQVRPYLTKWNEAVTEYKTPSGKYPRSTTAPGTYIQWNLGKAEWEWVKEEIGELVPLFTSDDAWMEGCLPTPELQNEYAKETHWRMVLIGNNGAGMFNHQDTLRTSSFQAQVRGSKTWHLCGPDQSRFMYDAGEVDFFKPNYKKRPLAKRASCYMYTVHEGDMMYYPRDWWHQTHNEEGENISVTGTLFDGLNFDSISEELQKDVDRPNPIIMSPSPALKAALQDCFQWGRDAYAGTLTSASLNATNAAGDTLVGCELAHAL